MWLATGRSSDEWIAAHDKTMISSNVAAYGMALQVMVNRRGRMIDLRSG
jgi:hypothetical protein